MRFLVAFYLVCLICWIVARILRLAMRRQVELLSIHTVFLGGFTIFQLTSSILGLAFSMYGDLEPADKVGTPVIFAFVATIFLILFEWSYKREWALLRRARTPGKGDWDGGAGGWIFLSIVLLAIGGFLKFVLMWIPLIGILASQAAAGVLAAAAASAAWAWSRNFRNPMLMAIAGIILLAAIAFVSYQSFGRRGVVGIPLAFAWGLYYGYWRGLPMGLLIRRVTIAAVAGLVLLSVYTATRREGGNYERQTLVDRLAAISQMRAEDFSAALTAVLSGQNSGPLSMWALETYGSAYPYNFLHQIKFFVAMPVPRNIWANKPYPLAKDMVHHGSIRNKGSGDVFNVGPGIIGHIAHDFPFIALPVYAIGIGLIVRFLDERVRWALHRPFVMIPIGCALGQTIAFSRGEAGLFMWNGMMALLGAWFAMRLSGRFAMMFGAMGQTDPTEPWDPLYWDPAWDEQPTSNDPAEDGVLAGPQT
ncbi:MAG: hypothetical protein MK077_08140 [Phycisphaerales bacterium]|nr:hypothetical protein [Phycisphaerales bacterium]